MQQKLETLVLLLVKEESSGRRFIITGDERSLWDIDETSHTINKQLSELSVLVNDNKDQVERCLFLERLFQKKLSYVYQSVNLKKSGKYKQEDLIQIVQEGSIYMSQIMLLKNRMELEEDQLLKERQGKAYQELEHTNSTIIISALISLVSITLITIIIYKERNKQTRIEEELKALNFNKNKFFSIISHDLRGPANGIVKLIGFLRDKNSTPEDTEHIIGLIEKSSFKLVSLLENLLRWARIQMDNYEYKPKILNIADICHRVTESLRINASLKNIAIETSLKNDYIMADEDMIETAIRNIISNSIKFTHSNGKISISTLLSKNSVSIIIRDTGIGMSEETINNLFKLERASSTKGTANEVGSGLGLLLCKEFIEKNSGTITIQSKINEGSIFILNFPIVNKDILLHETIAA